MFNKTATMIDKTAASLLLFLKATSGS